MRVAVSRPSTWRARCLGAAVAVAGIVNLVSSFTPGIRERVEFVGQLFTPGVTDLAAGATAVLGLALVLLGRGLSRRRRVAYVAATVALAVSAVGHLLKGVDVEEALCSLVVLGALVANRRIFTVRPCPRRTRTMTIALPVIAATTLLYGVAGLYLERDGVRPALTLTLAVREISSRLVGLPGPLHLPDTYVWLPISVTVIGALSCCALLGVLLAPVADARRNAEGERSRVRALVDRVDGDTLDPFALRRDKSYVFSSDGKAALAYRYVNGVGLGSGDPVGEPASFAGAVHAFLARCETDGRAPAIMGVRDVHRSIYESAGLRAHYLGDEAIIDVPSFSLEGRAMRPVRQACNRADNFGLNTEIHREGELTVVLRAELQALAARARQGAPERGFSMALYGLLSGRDRDCVVVLIRESDGSVLGFQRYVPCRSGRGLSLDAMRRERRGPNGINERMICDVVEWARPHGIDVVSLNFAFFRAWLDDGARLSPLQSVEAWVVRRFNPYFQIESLLRFNAKFHPRWVPRHLVYRSIGELASVSIAALSAEAFLPFDRRDADEQLAA
jgi:lysyl-tRNA synthetase, class II